MPSTGSFMIDPRTIPDEHFEVHWGNMASPNNTDWVLKVTMPMSAVERRCGSLMFLVCSATTLK